jgi:hypothetical protein
MKALRAVNNFLASASLTLAMLIIFIMVDALFLSATTRFITHVGVCLVYRITSLS